MIRTLSAFACGFLIGSLTHAWTAAITTERYRYRLTEDEY